MRNAWLKTRPGSCQSSLSRSQRRPAPTLSKNKSIAENVIGHVKVGRGQLVGNPAIKLEGTLLGDSQRGRQRDGPRETSKKHYEWRDGDLPGEANERAKKKVDTKGDGRSTTGREKRDQRRRSGKAKGASSSCSKSSTQRMPGSSSRHAGGSWWSRESGWMVERVRIGVRGEPRRG